MNNEVAKHNDLELTTKIYYSRIAGYGIDEIAERLDIPREEVINRYNAYRVQLVQTDSLDRELEKRSHLDLLEHIQTTFVELALSGDTRAAETLLKYQQQRAKVIGFDQVQPTTPGGANNILIVSGDKEEFLKALQQGQGLPIEASEKMETEEDSDE